MKRPTGKVDSNAYWVREYTWRANQMLEAALAGKSEAARAWLPIPPNDRERARYEGLARAAEKVAAFVDECEFVDDFTSVDMMLQFSMLRGLAADWDHRRDEPQRNRLRRITDVGRENRRRANQKRTEVALRAALDGFNAWCKEPRRSVRLSKLSEAEKLREYLKAGKPSERDRRRLNAHLKNITSIPK